MGQRERYEPTMLLSNTNYKIERSKEKIVKDSKRRVKKQKAYLKNFFKTHYMKSAQRAMKLAIKYHNKKRKSGQEEVSHQLELISYGLPLLSLEKTYTTERTIVALFLHDFAEDINFSDISKEDLKKAGNPSNMKDFLIAIFDTATYNLILSVTKKPGFRKTIEDYEEYYAGISRIRNGIIVKMIDRLNNMESMIDAPEIFTIKKREAYVREVELFMLPLAREKRKLRSVTPERYQLITLLIKELKIYSKFIRKINALETKLNEHVGEDEIPF